MGNFKDALRALLGKPVQNEAYRLCQLADALQCVRWFDIDREDMRFSQALLGRRLIKAPEEADGAGLLRAGVYAYEPERRRIQWLLCNFKHPYGGVFTILRLAEHLQKRGWENTILVYDAPDFDIKPQMPIISRYFPALREDQFRGLSMPLSDLPPAEIGICTFWASAYTLLKMRNVRNKVYLIQDYEPAFYPAGTKYALAENTYRMPFHRVFNTSGLMRFVEENYPMREARSMAFTPGCDRRYLFLPKLLTRPIRVLFYARPGAPRNAFELGLGFASALKSRYGEGVQIVAAGEELPQDIVRQYGDVLECAGVVPYEDLPEFYSSFHFLISFMLSKHPSYLPFEAMGSGCAVIANRNEANDWFFMDGENCVLADAAVAPLMEAFERAMDPEVYRRIVAGGKKTADSARWEVELRRVDTFLRSL